MSEISIGSDSTAATIAENIKKGQASCACAQAHFKGDWLIANFYAGQNFPDGKMDRRYLDNVFPEQPVLVRDVSCHNVALNTAALIRVGYGDDVQDPPRASICEGLMIFPHIVHAPESFAQEKAQSLHHLIDTSEDFCSQHVDARFVKFWMNGVPISPHFTQCDIGPDGHPNEERLLLTFEELLEALTKHDAKGLTCKIHCAGDGSARRALDVLERVRQSNPSGPVHELAHCNAIHQDDIKRMAELRIMAEMPPAIFHNTNLTSNYPHIFKWPFKELQDTGVHVTVGSDWFLTDTPDLFPALSAIVERFGTQEGKMAKEVGGAKICRIITLAGTGAVGKASEMGSIETGKKANFIAVDQDLSRGEFSGAKVLKTWFEGKLVWEDTENAVSM
ncbi:hypothetical protein FPHYL_6773 [Fusarium phyllophilum]|uniref:Amidohydrolase 3 domain-containing protein n=1 Tax=Fusarium phyllophilum TaxID=47803 RepID=A0A8H5NB22_9HYPO|nr:hypothetical protein FPHYL_6773 [Fusarium phyllophilum]